MQNGRALPGKIEWTVTKTVQLEQNLFHLGGSLNIPIGGNNEIEITLTARNIFDTRYYNHLRFLQES